MKIRIKGAGSFDTLTAAAAAWAGLAAPDLVEVDPAEAPETAAASIEARRWAQDPHAPRGTEEEQWRDGRRHALALRIAALRKPADVA